MDNTINETYELPILLLAEFKKVFSAHHPTQVLYDFCNKMKIPLPTFSFEDDSDYSFSCICKVDDISVIGFNNNKKEAKKIASELAVFELVKSKKYWDQVKNILTKEYQVSSQSFICQGFHEYPPQKDDPKPTTKELEEKKENKEPNNPNKNNDNIKDNIRGYNKDNNYDNNKDKIKGNNNDNNNDNNKDINKDINKDNNKKNNKDNDKDKNNSSLKAEEKSSANINLADDKVKECVQNIKESIVIVPQSVENNLNPLKNDSEDLLNKKRKRNLTQSTEPSAKPIQQVIPSQFPFDMEAEKITCMKFELFCLKFERTILLSVESEIELNNIINFVDLISIKLKTKKVVLSHFPIGSYRTKTMRDKHLEIDYLIEFKTEVNASDYQELISVSYSELKGKGYSIDFINEEETPYVQLVDQRENICRIFLSASKDCALAKEHYDFISQRRLTVDEEIAIKIIKSWRRDKRITYLSPMLIEFVSVSFGLKRVYEIVLGFFGFLLGPLDEVFPLEYQNKITDQLKNSSMLANLRTEVRKCVDAIQKNKFEILF